MDTRVLHEPEELIGVAWSCTEACVGPSWFRGQADARWSLQPEVCRPEILRGRERRAFEDELAKSFRRQAEARLSEHESRSWTDWLALMQHHGAPTRLLDWTTSILVAAFFAVHGREQAGVDGAIWALDPVRLNEVELGQPVLFTADDPIGTLACMLPFSELPSAELDAGDGLVTRLQDSIVAMEPHESFARMLLQQSRFTVHGRSRGLEESPAVPPVLSRFVIPAARKDHFERTLALLGIRLSTVFPDLDHLAEELRENPRRDGLRRLPRSA